ncbi:TPA: flagellar biosynthesis protein FlhF [Vibrio parahaemolyticus]|uniref:flagellar biosynthesis protein FlhF n=1 Tax=Vibrio parahaemolyticus TaxID=670 RepID=UPI0009401986|nr:flagellar biosynthesis protein FlhF [Vibrio parahaemolyticus]HCG9692576.1 flagellar biosynthesis protein FlhF [Vibrio parahaemolyticus]HCH1088803.1 flagellar biosynthesis protein FlhF [Vibrio parahaemolyticus]HCH1586141.1 flagellar biosynthesis protein FlhF [Vibrio parahaemolyticus]HCM0674789.1 flagellar biosynthesis protein FlhF [Vibrio parahaemolyticus]HCM0877427.1 flagellar biosynthesis protein FlhF [Vibrio parahaemolyticus]
MKIKRFFAKDMRSALLQVKEELGADAVIMSNKKVAGGVAIVAAVDNESNPSSSSASSQSNRGASQSNRYNEHRQMSSSAADRFQDRSLDEDKISLQNSKEKSGSMTQRFANMLKQYSGGAAESDDHVAENEDSLSALLQRQNKHRESYNQEKPVPYQPDSPLAKLIAQDNRFERPTPKLDPTRYDSRRPSSEERDESAKELENMREEMTSIRRLLEHQVSGLMWQEVERREPLRAMLIKRLERMGVSPELADQMACYIPEDTKPARAWKALLSLVADQINIPKQDILKRGGVVALLGPTGVGKTTTVAKLAARAAMEYGADNVALVTTDTYRIGAHEQLSIYGRIMGCPVRVAKDSNELADVIYQLRNRRLILVDTAGMGQRDVRLSEQLDTLMQESGEVIHSYLVLPATAQRRVLQETLDHFRRIPLSGCILTKLDESLSLGEFISVVIQNAMPVAYIANGQRVPEDIVIAQPKYMLAKANELLEKSTENEPHFWNSDNEGL